MTKRKHNPETVADGAIKVAALRRALRALSRASHSIYTVRLVATAERISAEWCDGTNAVRVSVLLDNGPTFTAACDVAELVAALPRSGGCTITGSTAGVTVRHDTGLSVLVPGVADDVIPAWPSEPADGFSLDIPAEAAAYVARAGATQTLRYAIGDIYLDCADDAARLVATDGLRMHVAAFPPAGAPGGVLIPRTMMELAAGCRGVATLHVVYGNGKDKLGDVWLTGDSDGFSLTARMPAVDGVFPPWRYVVPGRGDYLGQADFDRAALARAARAVAGVIRGAVKTGAANIKDVSAAVTFNGSLTIAPYIAGDVGDAITITLSDGRGTLSAEFNPEYLDDATSFPGTTARAMWHYTEGNRRSIVIQSPGEGTPAYTAVVMPICQ